MNVQHSKPCIVNQSMRSQHEPRKKDHKQLRMDHGTTIQQNILCVSVYYPENKFLIGYVIFLLIYMPIDIYSVIRCEYIFNDVISLLLLETTETLQ